MAGVLAAVLLLVDGVGVLGHVQGDHASEWHAFKGMHHRTFTSEHEENQRFEVFSRRLDAVHAHPEDASFTIALNHLSDRLPEEVLSPLEGEVWPPEELLSSPGATSSPDQPPNLVGVDRSMLPESLDWSTTENPLGRPLTTVVKDQMQCGACWAFTAVESVEATVAMNTGIVESLSAQELIDCEVSWDKGCVGGNPAFAYPFILRHGITSESIYPYVGRQNTCREDLLKPISAIRGYHFLTPNREDELQSWVAVNPVAVGLCGTSTSFLLYSGGVYDDPNCGTDLNHALLIVGYGTTQDGKTFWLAKNSWGRQWGENGYIRLARNSIKAEGTCGLAKAPSFAFGGFGGNASDPTTAFRDGHLNIILDNIRFYAAAFVVGVGVACSVYLAISFTKDFVEKHRRAGQRHLYTPVAGGGASHDPSIFELAPHHPQRSSSSGDYGTL